VVFFFADTRDTRFFVVTFFAVAFFVVLFRVGFFADRLTAALPIFTTSSFNCVVFATMTPAVVPTVRANDVSTPSFLVSIFTQPPSTIQERPVLLEKPNSTMDGSPERLDIAIGW
jgi:hypothetical protein